MSKHMFAMKFDDKMRAAREKGIRYEKISTVFENTPEFESLWEAYKSNEDPFYHLCTEDDGRTHTFYYIHLPTDPELKEENAEEDRRALV